MYKKSLFLLSITIIGLFFAMIGWSVYRYYALLSTDNAQSPTVMVSSGTVTVVRGEVAYDMKPGESFEIQALDRVISGRDSLARIIWPDGSLSRIGGVTELSIRELSVEHDLSSSHIEIDLERGKIWTNIVRAFFGDSYFNTRIPGQSVTAAVRGTVYEINLDQDYIHSVNHAVNLTDRNGKSIDLLPGEVVRITNIFDRLTQAVLDSAWNALNQVADTEFITARTKKIQAQIASLSGTDSLWDRFIRWILSYLPSFDRIKVARMLDAGTENFDTITSRVSTASLVRWYQDIANTDFSADLRQNLREKILTTATPEEKKILEPTLIYGAIWDRFSATSSGLSTSLDSFISKMGATATPEIRKLYDSLNKQLKVEDIIQQGIDTIKNSIQDMVKPN